jgi:predicted transcriptional regulator
MTDTLTELVGTRMTPATVKRLEQIAKAEDRSVAYIVRRAVLAYITALD